LKQLAFGLVLLSTIAVTTYFQSEILRQRPTVLKLGPVPNAEVLKALAGEHRVSLALRSVARVMFYFGSFFDPNDNRLQKFPEYQSMFKHLENAVKIDPYNMDAYYFAQAAFTWEVGHAKDVNKMLDYGMQYRTWDYWLPFYAGFNAAYFLKDYATAAKYMQIAAKMSNNSLYTRLAARYFNEAGKSGLGLAFLETMAKGARNETVKGIYEKRIAAYKSLRRIEDAVASFVAKTGKQPDKLATLVRAGLMQEIPQDPYGGEFYLDATGKVRTTSDFAMMSENSTASPDLQGTGDINKQKKDKP